MSHRKLDFLVPHYKEGFEVIKPLLDSINLQQNVDLKNDIGVIIVNDGDDVILDEELFKQYDYPIEYYVEEHRGVSATRNSCLDHSKADYVMWCDADDMLCSACGLWIIFREIKNGGFDSLTSVFMEESVDPKTGEHFYINRGDMNMGGIDSTFVHGKVHNRQFLLNHKIRFNPSLTIHEDSPINILIQKLSRPERLKYCPVPFYLWKWRDESVCRHDPKYILKTYINMLEGNTYLIHELVDRGHRQDACFYVTSMVYDAYYTFNCKEWLDTNNKEYRDNTEKRFAQYYKEFKHLYDAVDENMKIQINAGMRNRFFQQGLMFEEVTFGSWIKHIEELSGGK